MKTPAKSSGFRLYFEDNPQPMWVFARDTGKFLAVNRAAVERYGYTSEEFAKKRVAEITVDPVAAVPESRTLRQLRHRLKDGRIIDVEVAEHEISHGRRKAVLAVLLDITDHKRLAEQLRQAQKMEAVGMLAGGIAHDFNNLLTIINGYSQLVLNTLAPDDSNRSAIEQILKAGERAGALTGQLLAFSRRQVLQPKVIDINPLVSGLAVMLRRVIGEDIELRIDLGQGVGRVNADPGQLEQVIMNLVVNARDAMPSGGILTIETKNVDLRADSGSSISVRPGLYVMLAVSDNGIGMSAETRAHLFEPFFTTKGTGRGTGLGLSTVFGIVRQSGGALDVYSEPGKGTSFKIFLPRLDRAADEPEATLAAPGRGSETILLVEDDDTVRKLVRETLESQGYLVLDAPGAADAQAIATRHDGPIPLLITDVVMPRLSGPELAKQLTAVRPDMKVLFISGYTDNAVVNNGVLTSSMAFLQKPFTPSAIARKVRQVLEKNGHRTGGAAH